MFYVYEWYIVDTNEVFYVGKGTRNRYRVRSHNRYFDDFIRRYECDSRIVKEFESEQDAFEFEFNYVNEMKAKGQCVCNINKGGSGGSTSWWTEETRHWYSENNAMKSEEQRKRMSEKNPMKDPAVAKRVSEKKSRAVIIGEKEYASVKDAMESYGVCYDTIASWCRKGINYHGEMCRFKDSEQALFTDKRYNKGGCKAIIYCDKRYESITDCAKELGVDDRTVIHWLKRGYDIKGNICRYEGDNKDYEYVNPFKGKSPSQVKINGIRFISVEEASKHFGVSKTTLYAYLQGRRKGTKYICEYIDD